MIVVNLPEAQKDTLGRTYPKWRIGGGPGYWFAIRGGYESAYGPGSLLRCYLCAPDLGVLALKLSLQQLLDGLTADELAEVWRTRKLPAPADHGGAS